MFYTITEESYILDFLDYLGYTIGDKAVYIADQIDFRSHMEALILMEEFGNVISEDIASMAGEALERLGYEGC